MNTQPMTLTLDEAFETLTEPGKYPTAVIKRELPNMTTVDKRLLLGALIEHDTDIFVDDLVDVVMCNKQLLKIMLVSQFNEIAKCTFISKLYESCESYLQSKFEEWLAEQRDNDDELATEKYLDNRERTYDMQSAMQGSHM